MNGAPTEAWLSLRFDTSPLAEDPVVRRHLRAIPSLGERPALREDVREMAARGWADRTRSEYIGVMVVRHFHGLLADINAPSDLQELAITMMLQEQQHARLCAGAVQALGESPEVDFEAPELAFHRSSSAPEDELWAMILGTYCVGEVVAHALIRHALRALPASPYRDILKAIARDEVLHAHIGTALLRSARNKDAPAWLQYPGDAWVFRQVAAQQQAMLERDVIESDEAEMFEDPEAADQLCAVGIPPSVPFKAAYVRAVHREVPKALWRAGLPAQSVS